MPVLRRLVLSALVAGLLAGSAAALMQLVWVTPLILDAESYEMASVTTPGPVLAPVPAPLTDTGAHSPTGARAEAKPWPPIPGDERIAYSLVGNAIAGIAYGLLLAAGMTLSGSDGVASGLLWGMAGYASVVLAPALGLPPELPGMAAGDVAFRQTWWIAAAAATAAGLGLLAWAPLRPLGLLRVLGVLLLLLPHVVGAPVGSQAHSSLLPPDLAARFVASALVSGAVFWALLGAVCGAAHARLRGGAHLLPRLANLWPTKGRGKRVRRWRSIKP